jgi:hypothetical protein
VRFVTLLSPSLLSPADSLTKLSFEKDFTDVLLTRKTTQQLKEDKKIEQITTQLLKESQTYTLLVTVLDDLMHFRRGKRIAFARWLSAVAMEGTIDQIYRTESSLAKIEEKKRKIKEEGSDDGTGTWTEETGTLTGEESSGGGGKSKRFIMTEEDEFKLHKRSDCLRTLPISSLLSLRRIMEMTKRIQESDADEEAYSQYMREYHSNRHLSWFGQHRTLPIEGARRQIISMSLDRDDKESGNGDLGLSNQI